MSEADPAGPAAPSHDPSAVLAAGFPESLRLYVEEHLATGDTLALLLIESGVVGRIDAAWGYGVGDAVRARIVEALRANLLKPGDLIGEMGRDEIACVLSQIDGPAVAILAAEKALRALAAPFWIGEEEIFANPAIGISICPAHGDQQDVLLQRAKSACRVARGFTGRIAVYEEDQKNPEAAQLVYENRLRAAVSEDALELVFQPQYDLRLGQIMGIESLLRWRDAALGVAPTEDAFAAAESAGAVIELVNSVLNRALRNCSEFRYSAGLDLRIAVNISARALLQSELPHVVERALRTWNLRPGRLIIELAETSVLAGDAAARETLLQLKKLGVKLSIDDAGLALTSLFWMAGLPFQEIKIDLARVPDPTGASNADGILPSLVELAHHLKLEVVAVGVADEATADRLKQAGCDYMQGDYRGPALDAEAFVVRYGLG